MANIDIFQIAIADKGADFFSGDVKLDGCRQNIVQSVGWFGFAPLTRLRWIIQQVGIFAQVRNAKAHDSTFSCTFAVIAALASARSAATLSSLRAVLSTYLS